MADAFSIELRYLIYTALLMVVLWVPYILAELNLTGVVKALGYYLLTILITATA